MTSNQIAFATLEEERRHQPIVEAETKRHNLATESIANDSNAIQAAKNSNDAWFNRESLRLNKEIADNKLKWEIASGKRKLELEAEGNLLRSQLNDITDAYNVRTNDIRAQEVDVKARAQQEDVRHNLKLESIEDSKLANTYWFNSMMLDYNERKLETESGLKREELAIARDRVDADIIFRTKELSNRETELEIQSSLVGANILKATEEVKWLPFDVFFRGVGSAARLFQ